MPETTAVSHQESPGLPSGVEENEINPKQPTQLPLPAKFDGANGPKQAECWMKWSRHFERYRVASGLKNKPEHEQVSTLLYAIGDCADDILATLHIDENKATYEEVCTALNLIVQRARFNKRQAVCLSKKQTVKRVSVNEVADLEDIDVPLLGEVNCGVGDFWTAVVRVRRWP